MAVIAKLLAFALLLVSAFAIYPDDHWTYATKLTNENHAEFLASNIAAGKTVFAPTWNVVASRFQDKENVVFGDISLADGGPRLGQPGAGGWPTVRFYSKETGIEGEAYTKKTSMAMCDELGDETYMQGFIEEKTGITHEIRPTPKAPKGSADGPPRGPPKKPVGAGAKPGSGKSSWKDQMARVKKMAEESAKKKEGAEL